MLCCDRDPFAAHRQQMRSLFGSFGMDPFPLVPQIQHPRTRLQVCIRAVERAWFAVCLFFPLVLCKNPLANLVFMVNDLPFKTACKSLIKSWINFYCLVFFQLAQVLYFIFLELLSHRPHWSQFICEWKSIICG